MYDVRVKGACGLDVHAKAYYYVQLGTDEGARCCYTGLTTAGTKDEQRREKRTTENTASE